MRFATAIVLTFLGRAMAAPDVRPVLTMVLGDSGNAMRGFSPAPTGIPKNDPQVLFKRATVPDPLCAYISADPYDRFSCYNGQYCGVRPELGVVGCCSSYSQLSDGDYTLTGCEFRTTCYGRAETAACTGSCTADARVAYCTRSDYPYCLKYSITDAGLSFFRCNSESGVTIEAAYTYTTPSTTPTETTTDTSQLPTASGNPSVTNSDGRAETVSASPTTTVFVDTSNGKSNVLGAAVGGAVGGAAVVLIAIGVAVWFWMKHKKNKRNAAALAAGAAAGAGAGAAGAAGASADGAGAYGANNYNNSNNLEYYKAGDAGMSQQQHNGDVAPPYPSPPLSGYPFPITSPTFSNLSNSPMGTPYSQPLSHPLQEADGKAISPAQSPGPQIGAAPFNRESTASPSVVGSEAQPYTDGNRSELEGPTSQHLATASASGSGAQPSSSATQQPTNGPKMGYQSDPTSDWNKPFHELE